MSSRGTTILLAIVLIAVIAVGAGNIYVFREHKKFEEAQRQKVAALTEKLNATQKNLSGLRSDLSQTQSRVNEVAQANQQAQKQLQKVSQETQSLKTTTQKQAQTIETVGETVQATSQLVSKLQQSDVEFTVSELQETVLQIRCQDEDGDDRKGSGVLISPKGIVLTNAHVAAKGRDGDTFSSCQAFKSFKQSREAEEAFNLEGLTLTQKIDAALLRITSSAGNAESRNSYPYLPLGNSSQVEIGSEIFIAGFPQIGEFTFNLTEGIISGTTENFIKTDAKVDKGNSGGAALNPEGKLIGLPTVAKVGRVESLGFLVKINLVKQWVEETDIEL